jgi:hypothetical protein
MTRKKFREGLLIFETIKLQNSPNLEDKATEDILFMLLKHLSDEAFMRSVKILASTSTFFPTPAAIIKAAIPENMLTAVQAWEEVRREMDQCCGLPGVLPKFSSPIICKIVSQMGGLHSIWIDSRDQGFVRKEFIQLYNEIISSDKMITEEEIKELEGKCQK